MGARICAAVSITSTCCRPPVMFTLARSPARRRRPQSLDTAFGRQFPRFKARTAVVPPRQSARWPKWTTPAPAGRCSIRSSHPRYSHGCGLDKLVQLVRTYFKLDGHHIQFNVVDAATLRAARQNPEQYRSLIVRVAGYSDYFCDLRKTLQEEIIARTGALKLTFQKS